jgi:hypothetical protein
MEIPPMNKLSAKLVAAAITGLLAVAGAALAQSHFDAGKFFKELDRQGVKMPVSFDGKKFFQDLDRQGVNSTNRIDPKRFFEELDRQGVKLPVSFDSRKFFQDLDRQGVGLVPPMVDMKN